MRGDDVQQEAMFSYLSPEARVPRDHPLRPIRDMVNKALAELAGRVSGQLFREGGPSIPPEKSCLPRCCKSCTLSVAPDC